MKHYTHTIWNLDYNDDSGEIEWMYCDRSEWNGVSVTPEQGKQMEDEFASTGRTSWTGARDHIDFVRGPGPDFDEVKRRIDTENS